MARVMREIFFLQTFCKWTSIVLIVRTLSSEGSAIIKVMIYKTSTCGHSRAKKFCQFYACNTTTKNENKNKSHALLYHIDCFLTVDVVSDFWSISQCFLFGLYLVWSCHPGFVFFLHLCFDLDIFQHVAALSSLLML